MQRIKIYPAKLKCMIVKISPDDLHGTLTKESQSYSSFLLLKMYLEFPLKGNFSLSDFGDQMFPIEKQCNIWAAGRL